MTASGASRRRPGGRHPRGRGRGEARARRHPATCVGWRGVPSLRRRRRPPRPGAPAARRRQPPAGHVLRRRDGRARRAVGGDLRQLGGQDRRPARRRAHDRARRHRPRRPPHALARPGVAGRAVEPRGRRDRRPVARRGGGPRRVRARATSRSTPPPGCRSWRCRCSPWRARFRSPLPTGVVDYGEVVWSQPDLFVPADPPEPDRPGVGRRRPAPGRSRTCWPRPPACPAGSSPRSRRPRVPGSARSSARCCPATAPSGCATVRLPEPAGSRNAPRRSGPPSPGRRPASRVSQVSRVSRRGRSGRSRCPCATPASKPVLGAAEQPQVPGGGLARDDVGAPPAVDVAQAHAASRSGSAPVPTRLPSPRPDPSRLT